jgi:hypothetical protein
MTRLPARSGWEWLKQGGRLFRKQPAALATVMFANVLLLIGLSAVPILGTLAVVLIPSFWMAFMQACLMIDNGVRVTPAVLLTGFRMPVLTALCKVGLVYLGVSLVSVAIAYLALGSDAMDQMTQPIDPANPPQAAMAYMLPRLGIAVLYGSMLMTLSFAAPLVYWKRMGVGKAVFYSFFAVVRAAHVFVVLVASWFGICLILTIFTVLIFRTPLLSQVVLMWLYSLMTLLLYCAIYTGYRQIFGKPAGPDA